MDTRRGHKGLIVFVHEYNSFFFMEIPLPVRNSFRAIWNAVNTSGTPRSLLVAARMLSQFAMDVMDWFVKMRSYSWQGDTCGSAAWKSCKVGVGAIKLGSSEC